MDIYSVWPILIPLTEKIISFSLIMRFHSFLQTRLTHVDFQDQRFPAKRLLGCHQGLWGSSGSMSGDPTAPRGHCSEHGDPRLRP